MLKYLLKLQEEKIPPKPFVYEYGHVDPSGLASAKTESQDADGVVHGKTIVLFSMIILNSSIYVVPREKERWQYPKVSLLGVDSHWGDCTIILADLGS